MYIFKRIKVCKWAQSKAKNRVPRCRGRDKWDNKFTVCSAADTHKSSAGQVVAGQLISFGVPLAGGCDSNFLSYSVSVMGASRSKSQPVKRVNPVREEVLGEVTWPGNEEESLLLFQIRNHFGPRYKYDFYLNWEKFKKIFPNPNKNTGNCQIFQLEICSVSRRLNCSFRPKVVIYYVYN